MTASSRLSIPAGERTRRVTLQQQGARVDDGYGGGSVGFASVITRRAKIEPLAGEERFLNGQFDPSLTHRVTFRYYAGIRPGWRVAYGTRLFDIKWVADLEEAHRDVVLMCEELPAP
jgi:SPP1 family predicted phage head-tail adaptor